MKVCVDAGHGGADPGGIGTVPFFLEEKHISLQLAIFLEEELEARGHWVVMTRRRDRTLGLEARAAFANRFDADVFVSMHVNAAGTPSAQGMEVYHFPGSVTGRLLSSAVLASLIGMFPTHRDRGVKEANFAVLRLTAMPAVLIEHEFITNPTQLEFLVDPENQHLLAMAVADGLEAVIP